MNETAQVIAVKDNHGSSQWGKNPFLFRDGKKRSVHRRKLKYVLLTASSVLILVQCLFGGEIRSVAKASPIDLVPAAEHQSVMKLPMASQIDTVNPPRQHEAVGQKVSFSGPQLIARPRHLKAIPPGTMGEAVLVTGASNGVIRAKLTSAVAVGGQVEIDPGSMLVGAGSSSEERLYVQFNQVVFSDGTVGQISAQACDFEDRIVGLKGSNIGTKAVSVAGSIGLGFVGGLAEGLQETRGEQGAQIRPPTLENGLLNAVSRTALEQSQHLMSDLKGRKPVIEVPAGRNICVIWGDR